MKIRRLTDLQDAMLVEDARTSRPRLTPDQLLDKLINGITTLRIRRICSYNSSNSLGSR